MKTVDLIKRLRAISYEDSKNFNGSDKINYPYAYGSFLADITLIFDDLKLTEEQIGVMANYVEHQENRLNCIKEN